MLYFRSIVVCAWLFGFLPGAQATPDGVQDVGTDALLSICAAVGASADRAGADRAMRVSHGIADNPMSRIAAAGVAIGVTLDYVRISLRDVQDHGGIALI